MTFSIATLCTYHQGTLPPDATTKDHCGRFKGALIFDSVLSIGLVAISILAIVAFTTQTSNLQLFTHLYPAGAIALASPALVIILADLITVCLLKRRQQNQGALPPPIESPHPPHKGLTEHPAQEPMPPPPEPYLLSPSPPEHPMIQEPMPPQSVQEAPLMQHSVQAEPMPDPLPEPKEPIPPPPIAKKEKRENWDSIYTPNPFYTLSPLKNADHQCPILMPLTLQVLKGIDTLNSPNTLIEWFYQELLALHEYKIYLCLEIQDYFAWYFDVDIADIHKVSLDENDNITIEAIAACLELLGIIKVNKAKNMTNHSSARMELEIALKQNIWTEYALEEESSPIEFIDWSEIPLLHLLILSDNNFYYLHSSGNEYKYLHEEFIEKKTRATLIRTQYSDEDYEKFIAKTKRLNLNGPASTGENGTIISDAPYPHSVDAPEEPHPYESLEKLIRILVEIPRNGDFEGTIFAYAETLTHPAVANLRLPDMHNQRLEEIDIYSINMRVLALYLWNALRVEDYHTAPPSLALRDASRQYQFPIY